MRKAYPSDITREAFAQIEGQWLAATKAPRPRRHDLYDVFCAVLYVLKQGGPWRALPHDSPKWENCCKWENGHDHFRLWKKPDSKGETLLDRLLNECGGKSRA